MRCEMANPPKIFIDAKNIAKKLNICEMSEVVDCIDMRAPTITMPDIAFDTLIKGEWRAGVTPHTTK